YNVKLVVVSSNGCSDTVKKTVSVHEGPIADFSAASQCITSEIKCINKSLLKTGSFVSEWSFGDSTFSSLESPTHYYASSGSKTLSLRITSDKGCKDSVRRYVDVYSNPEVYAGNDVEIEKGFGTQLNVKGALSYTWSSVAGLSDPFVNNPIANPESSMIYIVEGMDKNGCFNKDTILVTVNDGFIVIPFNILTPDGNGLNDQWIVKNIQSYPENSVVIFDQWNQKVFETKSYKNDWAGVNQKGDILPDATYYYILRFPESGKKYTGYITLMRNKR
ncbi:MAG: gliding motility-associated C-terminal domain-containing protein, partial [Bacteroidia bacterium]|nr:gliding motility-associated C-terminal domain-containing protein [Bacteroidia bacterium]